MLTPASGEVLIGVGASSMTNTDLWTPIGAYGRIVDDQSAPITRVMNLETDLT